MLPLRTRIFIAASVVALAVLSISLILLIQAKKRRAAVSTAPAGEVQNSGGVQAVNDVLRPATSDITRAAPPKQATAAEVEQNGALQLAIIFIERYYSYSTDNNFQNIREVETLVTPELWKKLSARLSAPASAEFSAATTAALSSELKVWGSETAQIYLKVVKITESGGASARSYQGAMVTLSKRGGKWLVDSFQWDK